MSEQPPALPPATERSFYAIWEKVTLRYSDTDRQGHINNAVFATFCESGRVAFLYDKNLDLHGAGANFVIARLELDFRAELYYPGEVEIGTRVLAIGRSSFRLGQGIFKGDLCAATSESAMVLMNEATRRSTPLTPRLREWLEAQKTR